jgi:ribosome-associated toxin RatA of RatAB toxin-antitoxin module
MKWMFIIGGIFVLTVLIVLVIGLLQPVKHSVTRSIRLKQKPEVVFALLDDMTNLPSWSSTVATVEPMPSNDGKAVARCTLKWGHMQMVMTEIERTPPTRRVVEMAKENGTVLGTWTYEIVPDNDGCEVKLTEEGELKNPFFRVMARMRGLDANIVQTLRDLAKKYGESAEVGN